jgi:sugar lactone lactonase YvrE
MAVNFPDSPSNGDTFVVGSLTYTYTASTDVWDASGVTSAAIQISDTAPSNPSDGELWHNSSDLKLYIYYNDGSSSQWVVASPQQIGPTGAAGQVHMGIASPSAPASGEMWYDTETNDFSLYYEDGTSNQWITVSGPKGDDGADATLSSISESIIPDTDSAYDLGSATNKFRSLYLSSNTLFLGDSGSISAGPGGEIILPSIKIGTGANAVKLEADASGKLKTKKIISGVTQAAEEPGNATVVTDMAGLIALTGMSTGQIALVSALNKMFVYTGSGWFLIATVTNSSPTDITGVDATYSLASDGTATTVTAVSTDPEGFPLTWSYAVTTGSLGSTATVSQADNVFTITPSSTEADAGTFSITFSVTDGTSGAVSVVSAFSLGFGYGLSAASYDNLSFSVTSQDTTPQDLAFNSDGTKMFVLGLSSDAVYQYSLTTGFSLASGNVTYDNLSKSTALHDTSPTGLAFNSDGTKMFVLGLSSDAVHQYDLTTGFSLASGNVNNTSHNFSVVSQDTLPTGLAFNSDGTKMFVLGRSSDAVHQYSLTTGFSLASGNVTYDNLSFSVGSSNTDPSGLAFNSDGTKMFIIGAATDRVDQYSLTTGFSMAAGNVTYDNINLDVSSQESYPTGLAFNSDGTKLFVIGQSSDSVYQYNTSA